MRKKNHRFFFFFWNVILERYLPRWIFVIYVLTAMTFWLSASSTKVMYENQLFEIKLDNFFLLWSQSFGTGGKDIPGIQTLETNIKKCFN